MGRKLRFFTMAVAFLLMISSTSVAFANENETTVKIKVEAKNSYGLIIPASTSVTDFGWTDLTCNLQVNGKISTQKAVEVTIASANDFQLVNADKNESIAYDLRETQEGMAVVEFIFNSADVTVTGAPGKPIGIYVEKDEWNNVNDGEYSDVLTFSAKLTNAY